LIDAFENDEHRWSQLMAAAHRGDARLYEQLLRELGKAIERYIKSRFGALSFTEDCVQECLLAIHTGRHTYDPRRPFRPWLFTIVRNRTVDLLRRSYTQEQAAVPFLEDQLRSNERNLEDQISAGEILAKLKPQFRRALTLTKVCGYSLSEAAERSGITEAAMKSRVSRAVRAAEVLLNQERHSE
jgi:RNA polymerase sigma-70 factor (ECF subfamily)